jgi:hypothetical protein
MDDYWATKEGGLDCATSCNHPVKGCSMQLGKYDRVALHDDGFLHTRRDNIRDDITKRLRNVCSHLSDAEFKKLVETMADQKLKGERSRTV